MPSVLPGYEYDIFISYRQKDNRSDKWVTKFVQALNEELESTFKEDISVYFDENPHDGLLETHDVDKSLTEKVKCLVFIPIVSQTYCDPNCFAWQNEFIAFRDFARTDKYGIDIKTGNGNIAKRVLPVRIHEIDESDQQLFEKEIDGALRAINFIYEEPGVNRPLKRDDSKEENLLKIRYQNQVNKVANAIKELLYALQEKPFTTSSSYTNEPIGQPTPVDTKSIVVLPFVNISNDPEQEYFSDGLTEEIITNLSQLHDLLVISRSSAMTFKNSNKKINLIAKELNVQFILEGSVRKAGNKLRITAQLINAKSDSHLWAEKYDSVVEDVFDIQDKVSKAIVEALELKISKREQEEISARPVHDPAAYDCYLRARQEIWRFTPEGFDRAIQLVRNALDLIGENERLNATLGIVYWHYIYWGLKPEKEYLAKLEKCIETVFRLNRNSSLGFLLQSWASQRRENIQDAVRNLKKALTIDPNNSDALFWVCLILFFVGKTSSARPFAKRLLLIDPLMPINNFVPGLMEWGEGNLLDAIEPFEKSFKMDQKNPHTQFWYAYILATNNQKKEALAILELLPNDAPSIPLHQVHRFLKFALKGEKENALECITPGLNKTAWNDVNWAWIMTDFYALINLKPKALYWLERAIALGFINYPFLTKHHPFLENLRDDSHFKKLMIGVKKKWEVVEF